MHLELLSDVSTEPLSTADAKAHLRIGGSDEDDLIDSYITAARGALQEDTGRAFGEQQYKLTMRDFQTPIRLPKPPLVTVDSVKYYAPDASSQSTFTDYRIAGQELEPEDNWPNVDDRADAVQITFTCGTPVPDRAILAMQELVGLYEHYRLPVVEGRPRQVPDTYSRLARGMKEFRW